MYRINILIKWMNETFLHYLHNFYKFGVIHEFFVSIGALQFLRAGSPKSIKSETSTEAWTFESINYH